MIPIICFSSIILITLGVLVWKKFIKKQNIKASYIIMALVFPISHLLMVVVTNVNDYSHLPTMERHRIAFIVTGIIADVIALYILFTGSNKESLEGQLKEMEYTMEAEAIHKKSRENREEEICLMRASFEEELIDIVNALEKGDTRESKDLLESANRTVDATRTKEFCKNPIVNAVLSEKEKECHKQGISLNVEMQYGGDMGLTAIETCSLYANLLDNAIHAAQVSATEEKKISLLTKKVGDYITVKVENTADSSSQKKDTRRKHYGKEIIDDIVKKHDGEWSAKWDKKANRYEAIVIVLHKGE